MEVFEMVIAAATLAGTLLVAVYAAKAYHREPPAEEILPWDVY